MLSTLVAAQVEQDGQTVWLSVGAHPTGEHSPEGAALAAPRQFAADDQKLIRALARCWLVVRDGATVVLQRLQLLRLASGLPLQAMIVVASREVGQRLVRWLREQSFVVSRDGYPRVAMTTSDLRRVQWRLPLGCSVVDGAQA